MISACLLVSRIQEIIYLGCKIHSYMTRHLCLPLCWGYMSARRFNIYQFFSALQLNNAIAIFDKDLKREYDAPQQWTPYSNYVFMGTNYKEDTCLQAIRLVSFLCAIMYILYKYIRRDCRGKHLYSSFSFRLKLRTHSMFCYMLLVRFSFFTRHVLIWILN